MSIEATIKPTILIVDDTPANLRVLLDTLRDAGYKLLVACSGEAAIQQAEYARPDLILLDVMMPGINGFEACRQMKARAAIKDIPVIFMTALTDTTDKIQGFQAGGVDYITKPFQHEEVLARVTTHLTIRQLQQQLEAQNLLLQEKNVQLHALNASKDKFFSIIAHDLRSPMASVLIGMKMLTENIHTLGQPDRQEIVHDLQETVERLYGLLGNLLTWSRLQRGFMEYQPQQIELLPLVTQNIALFTANAEQKTIALRHTVIEPLTAYADANMVDTIIRNLLSNALKFTPAQGAVTISASASDHAVEVAVTDTGVGMTAAALNNLFRLDVRYNQRGTAGEQGTGLGLNLCKELVEKNGGRIWGESAVGRGTTFRFTLPTA